MRLFSCAAALAVCLSSSALAVVDLQVTEMFPGIEPGDNGPPHIFGAGTEDWFEVTNFGTMAWDPNTHGDLYFDDAPTDPNNADLMAGITSIAPGESVIFVDGDPLTGGLNVASWHEVWDSVLAGAGKAIPQVGTYNGSGMSNDSEDGASLFIDADDSGEVTLAELVDAEIFPSPDHPAVHGKTYDSDQGGFSAGPPLGVATAPNDEGVPTIGSPGYLVPEPTSVALFGMALAISSLRRRK